MLNFALCTDDNYTIPCIVTVISILENNKKQECNIYILTDSLKEDNRNKFQKIAEKYNQKIIIFDIDINSYSNLKVRSRYPKSMYYRFLLPDLLKGVDKVLYLDCDIIVRTNISSLFDEDLSGYSCCAVEDQQADDVKIRNKNLYLGKYFNSGVLLINLDYWRKNDIATRLVDFILQYPDRCFFPDQDALNIILEDSVNFISPKFNFQALWFKNLKNINYLFTKHEEIIKFRDNPSIVHFSETVKPWHIGCRNPFANEWLYYANEIGKLKFKQFNRIGKIEKIKQILNKTILLVTKK